MKIAIFLFALLVASVVGQTCDTSSNSRLSPLLRWAPPFDYNLPQGALAADGYPVAHVNITNTNKTWRQVAGSHTVFHLPANEPFTMKGGLELILQDHVNITHCALVGGEITRPGFPPTDGTGSVRDNYGIYLLGPYSQNNPGHRIWHIEGVRLGPYTMEGIDVNTMGSKNVEVRIQNCLIERVSGFNWNGGTHHPDVMQPIGGPKVLKIDGLWAQFEYQGLFLQQGGNGKDNFGSRETGEYEFWGDNIHLYSPIDPGYALWETTKLITHLNEYGAITVRVNGSNVQRSQVFWDTDGKAPNTVNTSVPRTWDVARIVPWSSPAVDPEDILSGTPGRNYVSPGFVTGQNLCPGTEPSTGNNSNGGTTGSNTNGGTTGGNTTGASNTDDEDASSATFIGYSCLGFMALVIFF